MFFPSKFLPLKKKKTRGQPHPHTKKEDELGVGSVGEAEDKK